MRYVGRDYLTRTALQGRRQQRIFDVLFGVVPSTTLVDPYHNRPLTAVTLAVYDISFRNRRASDTSHRNGVFFVKALWNGVGTIVFLLTQVALGILEEGTWVAPVEDGKLLMEDDSVYKHSLPLVVINRPHTPCITLTRHARIIPPFFTWYQEQAFCVGASSGHWYFINLSNESRKPNPDSFSFPPWQGDRSPYTLTP